MFYIKNRESLYARFDPLDGWYFVAHVELATAFVDKEEAEVFLSIVEHAINCDYIQNDTNKATNKIVEIIVGSDQTKYKYVVKEKHQPYYLKEWSSTYSILGCKSFRKEFDSKSLAKEAIKKYRENYPDTKIKFVIVDIKS